MASPVLLVERHAPGVRLYFHLTRCSRTARLWWPRAARAKGSGQSNLYCLKKCEEQDAAKIFNLKCLEHDFRAHFLSKHANFG